MPAEFYKGDLIVEREGCGVPAFGVVISSESHSGEKLLTVRSSSGIFHMFASQCLPYEEWLTIE